MFEVGKYYEITMWDTINEGEIYLLGTVKAAEGSMIKLAENGGKLLLLNTASIAFISAVEK